MKSFVLSLSLLALLLGGITWNFLYINSLHRELSDDLEALPDPDSPDCVAACIALAEKWEKHTGRVGLSVCFSVVDRVSEQTEVLAACAAERDRPGFALARVLLRDAFDDMRRLERFAIGNLL